MDDKYLDLKKEIEKINQRVKEYLWEKSDLLKTGWSREKNAWCQFLAR